MVKKITNNKDRDRKVPNKSINITTKDNTIAIMPPYTNTYKCYID